MMVRTGKVKAITGRDFKSTMLWSFQLEGSNRYYRTGKVQPDITEGQWITFEEKNGIVMIESIENAPVEMSVGEVSETAPATSATVTTDVGQRIRLQAARADATRIVTCALENDHLPHASNIAKGKRLDLLLQYVDEVTKVLLEQEDAS